MDVARFKQRREVQTQRHIVDGISRSSRTVSEVGSSHPSMVAASQHAAKSPAAHQPAAPRMGLGNELAASPSVGKSLPADKQAIRNFLPRVVEAGLQPAAPEYRLPTLDMAVPGSSSPWRQAVGSVRRGSWRSAHPWSFRAITMLLVVIIGSGGFFFSQDYLKLQKTFKTSTVSAAGLKDEVNPDLLKGEGDGRINILLLGRGGGDHEAPDLTDTMMLDSIDPVNHTSTMISVPRDLWVDVPNQGAMKINAAWETGEFNYLHEVAPGSTDANAIKAGFNEADQVVEQVLGVTIHYNLMVNFQAFKEGVDTVGGITVNVPSDLVDPTMARDNGGSAILAKAGPQTFNGKTALNYVRSRETTSDFARSQRQRAVLVALKNKVTTLGTLSNPLKISGLLNTLGN
ncbi:MAG: LCP family protein, partial [Candidatus Saccharimonadales bacterium]